MENKNIIKSVEPYTLTSPERLNALIEAVEYIIRNKIPGSIVECGVYKGGSVMAIMKTLLKLKNSEKEIYLFDTFEGMPKPSALDIDYMGKLASDKFKKTMMSDNSSNWDNAALEEVQKSVFKIGYDKTKCYFIKGIIEDTIPDKAPDIISLLRLDTDWYQSTLHELRHLFPRLSEGGVLIIDDYGHWKGAKKAVDEYFSQNSIPILLNRIDYTGRIGIKHTSQKNLDKK